MNPYPPHMAAAPAWVMLPILTGWLTFLKAMHALSWPWLAITAPLWLPAWVALMIWSSRE